MSIFGLLIQYLFDLFKINTTITVNNLSANTWIQESGAQVLGVLVGGLITIFITKGFNKRADKKQKEYQRRDSFYTPFCTLIEIVKEESYGKEPGTSGFIDSSEIDGEVWRLLFKDAKRYLKAEYRKHLASQDKEQLEELNHLLVQLTNMLDDKTYEIERSIEWGIAHAVFANIDTTLKSVYKINGAADVMIFIKPNTKRFILDGTFGEVDIMGCILSIGMHGEHGEISLEMDDKRIVDLVRNENNDFDDNIDYETRIKMLLYKQIKSVKLLDACAEANILINSSHDQIIVHETKILILLESILERLIREIDRISAA